MPASPPSRVTPSTKASPPPSDEEIIATFTDKELEFLEWYKANSRDLYTKGMPYKERREVIAKKRPGDAASQFMTWVKKWTRRVQDRLIYRMPASYLVDLICATDVCDPGAVTQLQLKMELYPMPFVLLGESDFGGLTGYGLNPGPVFLTPNYEDDTENQLTERMLLGINTDVPIEFHQTEAPSAEKHRTRGATLRQGCRNNTGEDDVRPSGANDADSPGGFLFLQIGALYAFDGEDWAESRKHAHSLEQGPWRHTEFGVVIRVNSNGEQEGVYLIFNFHQQDEESSISDRYHTRVFESKGKSEMLPEIGRLHKGANSFTVGRIADSLRDLKAGNRFSVDILERRECQIVRAKMIEKKNQRPILVRQFVRARH